MSRGLLTFNVRPNPAKEGQKVTITFTFPIDKTTLTLDLVNWDETVTKRIQVEVTGGTGAATFVIPKGWGPSLFVNHPLFFTEAIAVEP